MNPAGNPATLAAPFKPGNTLHHGSRFTLQALRKCRKLSPEMVDLLAETARDPNEPTVIRVRCAEIILNKALPSPKVRNDDDSVEPSTGMRYLEVVFVRPGEQLEAVRGANGLNGGHAGTFAVSFAPPEADE